MNWDAEESMAEDVAANEELYQALADGGESDTGSLIAIEGLDGAGKSTVCDAIADWAGANDREIAFSAEPTNFDTGDWTYEVLGTDDTAPVMDFFMFCADRRNHVGWIEERLSEGTTVVTDRYVGSTRAYQTSRIAAETGMDLAEARGWMETVFDPWNREPDLTIYIDIPVETAIERADGGDKYEREEQLRAAKAEYDRMYSPCDDDVRVLDGTRSKPVVRRTAINAVKAEINPSQTDLTEWGSGKSYTDAIKDDE